MSFEPTTLPLDPVTGTISLGANGWGEREPQEFHGLRDDMLTRIVDLLGHQARHSHHVDTPFMKIRLWRNSTTIPSPVV